MLQFMSPPAARVQSRRFSPRAAWLLALGLGAITCLVFWCSMARATDFLDPDQAFQFSARVIDKQHIEVHYKIAKGYYLYKERFRFAAEPADAKLGEPSYPPAEVKFDETFNKNVEHYRNDVTITIPVTAAGVFTLVSTAQGCADAGLCYPPQESRLQLDPNAVGPLASSTSAGGTTPALNPGSDAPAPSAQLSSILLALQSGNLLWISVFFVGLGLLLSLTPCVWPMVPILSSIIAGDACSGGPALLNRTRGFMLALAYSLGIAVIYTGLGVGAGLAGEGLAQALQRPVVLIGFALVLALLSLSMFGVYHLQMPSAIQTRLNAMTHRAEGGRFLGVFIMGAVSALVVGPCVAAPLAGTLLYISQTRDVVLGGAALFSLAIGMCAPLLVLGAWEGAMLPRAGAWMEAVKRIFGVLLLAVAIWMATPALPSALVMLLWALLFIISSVFLRAFDGLTPAATPWMRIWKGVGLVLFLGGVIQLIGIATGASDPMKPLGALALRGASNPSTTLAFETIHSGQELDQKLGHSGKPIMLDFTAAWCVACREMEQTTYTDQRVAGQLAKFTLVKADVTDNTVDERALLKRFSLFGPPGILFFDAQGHPVPAATVIGFQGPDTFLGSLAHATS